MGRYTGKTCRLLCMLVLTFIFFLAEIITGYITNSLALVGDSYHMLSDVIALIVGFASVRISKKRSQKNTFGWARAEVLGALVNSVFLVALCFTIFVEALQRLTGDSHVKNPDLMLIVGGLGLLINIIGLVLFHNHGHGHSHGGGGHKKNIGKISEETAASEETQPLPNGHISTVTGEEAESSEDEAANHGHSHGNKKVKLRSSSQLNMRGVFLHVLGDALGSVVVIISAILIKTVDAEWKHKADPAMSMVMVIIILSTTIPLLKESALILLQTVPTHIQVTDLQEKLLKKVPGVIAIHEFHIWQLAGNRIIASAHIRCHNLRDYMRVAEEVKEFFHNEGIHSTTIQPEFVEFEETLSGRDCAFECGPDKICFPDTCCANKKLKSKESSPTAPGIRQRVSTDNGSSPRESSNVEMVNMDTTRV